MTRETLKAGGHTIISEATNDSVTFWFTQKNDVYSDGEVERWHVYSSKGHVYNACRRSMVLGRFNRVVAA